MRATKAFLSGMSSAYEVSPIEKTHKAHFITVAESHVVSLNIDSNVNNSWKVIASCQKKAFNEICNNKHEYLTTYECTTTG
ncbi:hypothetical protein M5F04_04455 [Acinetobacter sp. ANC 7200]|uniref:hypothetical protein n=1 Tax=Acinetobacter amyesii TaxID=2942470 RepID=UPI0020C09999|nr:hypothetical protein [Acinetobacter amyesii]MCL6243824.1 hypothetical protein [Acinetobacter amyesii]